MKKTLVILSILASTALSAQNLDGMKPTQTDYSCPPMTTTLQDVKSIFVQATGYNSNNAKNVVETEINKGSYTLVGENENSDLIISVSVNKNTISEMRVSSETIQKTTKEGKPYTETSYYSLGSFKFNVAVKFLRKSGEIVRTQILEQELTITKDRTKAASKSDAESNFYSAVAKDENGIINSLALQAFRKLESDYLTSLETLIHVPLKVKSRKFDYADLNEAADLVNNWIAAKTFDGNDPNIVKAVKLYEEALKELNTEDKKVRVNEEIGAVCNFELAYINFALKNYAKANELILKSEALDKRINYSQEMLKNACAELQKRKAF